MRTTAKSSSSSSAPRRQPAEPVLERVKGPEDLAGLDTAELTALAEEIRGFLIEKVCAAGGHLGVNLGVVELTIALHRAFRSPRDALLFDTGHQSYVHKILTGRAPGFDALRRHGGLSGYPSRSESAHDWIENSHASTALSYADGLAKAFQLRGELADGSGDPARRHVVPVIGDGAMTGGLAWEGLNNLAGAADRPVVIVLNDNGRAYAPTIGGIATHLDGLRQGRRAQHLFGDLGLAYVGPVDGHDLAATEQALREAAALGRPALVHVITTKGRGFAPAECDEADRMHAVGVVDPRTGIPAKAPKKSWTEVFGEQMGAIGAERDDVVAVSAAMVLPVGLGEFARRFPDRVFDVGIAEQHAVCSSAGLAAGGLHPVVCVYSTFLNRAFDQVVMDVALHKAGVTFVLDRAGVTGPDGASHHGMWDSAILGIVPGLRLAAPRDPARLAELLREAVAVDDAPTVIRFPKAEAGPDIEAHTRMNGVDILYRAAGRPLDVLIIAAGVTARTCLAAAQELDRLGIGATVVDPRWILPVNPHLTHLADRHRLVVTVEDGVRSGGMGTAVAQACADAESTTPVRVMGLPPEFLAAGKREEILEGAGMGVRDVVATVVDGLRAGPRAAAPEPAELLEIPDIPPVVSKVNGSVNGSANGSVNGSINGSINGSANGGSAIGSANGSANPADRRAR
ncbi:1-deoxy-D-xylulose-5-phosphate synthase [Catenulispora sp. GP43]|uniref:1-deoxy-D-xylulose-5-phosphate synthase n=1 Tax=Catenulispora sp. GP43 TaxID=3156263 RepID=UPI003511487E